MPSRTRAVSVTVAAVLALAGCAPAQEAAPEGSGSTAVSTPGTGSASSTASGSSSEPGSPAASETGRAPLTVEITVTGRDVRPAPKRIQVSPGEPLRLVVTVDHDDVLHAHGFEVRTPIEAGRQAVIPLSTTEPGLYDIELHDPALRILQVLVR